MITLYQLFFSLLKTTFLNPPKKFFDDIKQRSLLPSNDFSHHESSSGILFLYSLTVPSSAFCVDVPSSTNLLGLKSWLVPPWPVRSSLSLPYWVMSRVHYSRGISSSLHFFLVMHRWLVPPWLMHNMLVNLLAGQNILPEMAPWMAPPWWGLVVVNWLGMKQAEMTSDQLTVIATWNVPPWRCRIL